MAAELGVSRSHLASIESGHDLPGRDTLFALAAFFGIGADELQAGGVPPGAPDTGEVVKDADELALLGFWRTLNKSERVLMLKMLRRAPD